VERIERRDKEEEERRGNEVEALPNRHRDHSLHRFLVLCSSCNSQLVLLFFSSRFECDLCTFSGPPLLLYAHSSPPSIMGDLVFFVKFKLNRSLVP